MALLTDILEWSEGISNWQSDALRRLITNNGLSDLDIEELVSILQTEYELKDPEKHPCIRLDKEHIPSKEFENDSVVLTSIKQLKNVNAIGQDATLPISPSGLTIIYGDNGSGKSGYSRLLKRVCRARDQNERIHPNANIPASRPGNVSAEFELTINDVPSSQNWTEKDVPPVELSALAVFDTRCARHYLDSEDDYSFVPYGLDLIPELAKACDRAKVVLEKELNDCTFDLSIFSELEGNTAVGKLVASIPSNKVKSKDVQNLANLNEHDKSRLNELKETLNESNPIATAKLLRQKCGRITAICDRIEKNYKRVDLSKVKKLSELGSKYNSAKVKQEIAAAEFTKGDSLLPGTGQDAWRELYEKAREFSKLAHPEHEFPNLEKDQKCPLCQQTLGESVARLQSFENYIQQECEKEVANLRELLLPHYTSLNNSPIDFLIDETSADELNDIDNGFAKKIRDRESALEQRRIEAIEAFKTQKWPTSDFSVTDITDKLKEIARKLAASAENMEKLSNAKEQLAMKAEYAELEQRVKLQKYVDSIEKAIEKTRNREKLEQCLKQTNTAQLSKKTTQLAKKYVTEELENSLNKEFKNLGVNSLRVALKSRTDKGKSIHKLVLDHPSKINLSEILSEGEQRAVAIGAFLAEVGVTGNKNGVIFDDPVSSLDHRRREKVAKRICQEAKARQVILFTHDIYFLSILQAEAVSSDVDFKSQSLMRKAQGFGFSTPDLPFDGSNTKKRIGALRQQHQQIEKYFRTGEEAEYRKETIEAYTKLRIAWERAVEEILFRDVVLRFRKSVETNRLKGVTVEDDDFIAINNGMTKCSNFAHDKAMLGGAEVPEPEALLEDISALDDWRSLVEERAKESQKRRA